MDAVVADERRTNRELRERVAEGAQREAAAARKIAELEERLAEARREMVALGDRTTHADAERSALERKMEASGRDTSREIAELCRKLEHEQTRAEQKSRALDQARERLDALERSRESFFARLIDWQKLSRADDVDLAEFIAELRGEIARLAAENEAAHEREESLRRSLTNPPHQAAREEIPRFLAAPVPSAVPSKIGKPWIDPPATSIGLEEARAALTSIESDAKRTRASRLIGELAGTSSEARMSAARHLVDAAGALAAPALAAAVRMAESDEERINLLEQLGRTKAALARVSIDGAIADPNPYVRAAAIEAKLALAAPDEVDGIARVGLSDRDPRVRRRVMLAVKAASCDVAELILPLLADPDPQARRTACAALAGERTPEVTQALVALLDDEVEGVRAAAAQSLGRVRREVRHGAR